MINENLLLGIVNSCGSDMIILFDLAISNKIVEYCQKDISLEQIFLIKLLEQKNDLVFNDQEKIFNELLPEIKDICKKVNN